GVLRCPLTEVDLAIGEPPFHTQIQRTGFDSFNCKGIFPAEGTTSHLAFSEISLQLIGATVGKYCDLCRHWFYYGSMAGTQLWRVSSGTEFCSEKPLTTRSKLPSLLILCRRMSMHFFRKNS